MSHSGAHARLIENLPSRYQNMLGVRWVLRYFADGASTPLGTCAGVALGFSALVPHVLGAKHACSSCLPPNFGVLHPSHAGKPLVERRAVNCVFQVVRGEGEKQLARSFLAAVFFSGTWFLFPMWHTDVFFRWHRVTKREDVRSVPREGTRANSL